MEDLKKYDLNKNPYECFKSWFNKARDAEHTPEAFVLATCGKSRVPSARVLLLKGYSPEDGFRFFTHSDSLKGRELDENPSASMVFYWPCSQRQVRLVGEVEKLTKKETLEYFRSRAHESQVASLISEQSSSIDSRVALEEKFNKALEAYASGEVPLPKDWQGYTLKPFEFEFFLYGEFRLNDRFVFKKTNPDNNWSIERLQP